MIRVNFLHAGEFCMLYGCLLIFFSQINFSFSIYHFRNTIRMSNSLDPDQYQFFFGPDLDPNCLQMLSRDNTRQVNCKVQ